MERSSLIYIWFSFFLWYVSLRTWFTKQKLEIMWMHNTSDLISLLFTSSPNKGIYSVMENGVLEIASKSSFRVSIRWDCIQGRHLTYKETEVNQSQGCMAVGIRYSKDRHHSKVWGLRCKQDVKTVHSFIALLIHPFSHFMHALFSNSSTEYKKSVEWIMLTGKNQWVCNRATSLGWEKFAGGSISYWSWSWTNNHS